MKKKNNFNIIGLIVTILLYACGNAPAATDVPLTPSSTATPMSFPTLAPISTVPDGVTATYPPYYSPTPTDTATPSSTPDYAALGIPSPTPTPTFNYEKLSSVYLTPYTPWPTPTGWPELLPTPNIPKLLLNVVIRSATPQPPFARNDSNLLAYIQRATDLMNYFDSDKEAYLQYINSWSPTAFNFFKDWFLEHDYDNDGQPEWLISLPTQFEDGVLHCGDISFDYCARYFFLFEKTGDFYYPVEMFSSTYEKVVLIEDLNSNRLLDIVFQGDPCGSACSTYLRIAEWDGSIWKQVGMSAEKSKVTFDDTDGNGTIEISLKYSTGAASWYNSPYPFRENLIDVYGWKNDRYELVDQIYPPTGSMFATIFDIARALDYKNAELALERINPVVESLHESCDRMKTYIGIQAMLAYAIQGDANAMKSTLAKLEEYCDQPRNAYVPAAKILWLSYKKSHDPINACQAMERFLRSEYNRENGRLTEMFFIEWRPTNRPSCPGE